MTDTPHDPLASPPPPVDSLPEPEVPDELAARRAQLLAELDDVEAAIAESGANLAPPSGSDAESPAAPAPGSAPSPADVEAARSAPPAAVVQPEPEPAVEPENGTQEDSEPVSGEPEPGAPAEPGDVAAARSAPPAPIDQR